MSFLLGKDGFLQELDDDVIVLVTDNYQMVLGFRCCQKLSNNLLLFDLKRAIKQIVPCCPFN